MNITNYFCKQQDRVSFTRQQASSFAKGVAGDFNPIHDVDNRRFCVPGDLLFSVFLYHYGIHQKMKFEFSGMVVDTTELVFPESISASFSLTGQDDKAYMNIETSGELASHGEFISALSEQYVQFSGQTFPHILVPLMEQEGVMINPARPLVIYKNMEIHLDKLAGENIELKLRNSLMDKNGKKAEVRLEFTILADGEEIGHGAKNLLLSGLKDYNQSELDTVVQSYAQWKNDYLVSQKSS